jgi:hypothetical protein
MRIRTGIRSDPYHAGSGFRSFRPWSETGSNIFDIKISINFAYFSYFFFQFPLAWFLNGSLLFISLYHNTICKLLFLVFHLLGYLSWTEAHLLLPGGNGLLSWGLGTGWKLNPVLPHSMPIADALIPELLKFGSARFLITFVPYCLRNALNFE